MNAFIGKTLFLFCGRRANTIKGLIWEGDGFLMLTKRLERGRYSWPRTSEDVRAMAPEQFKWLMHGFSIDPPIQVVSKRFISGYKKAPVVIMTTETL